MKNGSNRESARPAKQQFDADTILRNMTRSIVVTDLDGTVLYWNKKGEELFGYSEEEMLGESIAIIYPGQDRELFSKDLDKIRKGEKIKGQWQGEHKDGSTVWLDVDTGFIRDDQGEIEAIVSIGCDISDYKQIERSLQESRARAQAIIDTTVDAIITINEQGIIESFNRAAERIFGYEEEEVLGRNVNVLMPPPHEKHHDEYIQRYLETGEKHIIGIGREVKAEKKDGTVFPIELSVSEVTWDNNRIFTGIIKDISDRRRLEQELLEISEEERQNIGQDLHDGLGQMLTGIGLIARNLARKLNKKGMPEAEEVQEIADMIKEADEQAKGLARGLVKVELDSEGLRTGLERLCKQSAKLFELDCNLQIQDELKVEDRLMALNLYRIAQEAISNASRHGKASVVNVILLQNEEHTTLIVEDNGIGFDAPVNQQKKKGMGVKIMHHRANTIGGNLTIRHDEKRDLTRVICSVPSEANRISHKV
ncbi:MAG: PAS domain S-box protein [Balneolaceae bacterium]|nr:PAS domain S-box protein [Balneolaceae bacterium]